MALWLDDCGSDGGLYLLPIQIYQISFVNPFEFTHTNMGNSTPTRFGVLLKKIIDETDIPIIMTR